MPLIRSTSHDWSLPAAQDYLRLLVIALLCWSGVAALESSQTLVIDASRGYVLPYVHYVAWAVFNWFVLALLTPIVYEYGRRYPISGTGWAARLLLHAAACVFCLASQAVGRGIAGWVYTRTHENQASAPYLAGEWLDKRGLFGFLSYWIVVGVATLVTLREEVRQRQLYQAQLEASLASAELEKLRMQIQPHFLFNTLQAAITLVQEDPPAAEDVLLRLSELLRISFEQMEKTEISLARELEFLDLFVGIQKRRFGERIDFTLHADPVTLEVPVPPLILQPLVENAINHGIGKHKGQDHIEVFARHQNNGLQIEVWNANSVLDESTDRAVRGVGLRNTRARLEHLYGPAASLALRSVARGGAMAMIFIPASRVGRVGRASAVRRSPP